jgi:hypothetical protein
VLFREEGEGMNYTLKLSQRRVGIVLGALSLISSKEFREEAAALSREIVGQTNKQYDENTPQAAGKKRF